MRIVIVALAGWMLLAAGAAAAVSRDPVLSKSAPPWVARDSLQAPTVPTGIPADAAGCLVVGHHVLVDGSTAKARIMQGAYTSNVAAQHQTAFEAVSLAVADQWRFRYKGYNNEPTASFNTVVVGFGAVGVTDAPRAVIGIEAQDARVQPSCNIDLAAWGEQNAIPVEEARARQDQDMLLKRPGDPASYWTGTIVPGRYPPDAARHGAQACVVVGFRVGVDGVPSDYRIVYLSLAGVDSPRFRKQFERSALAAAAAWRYSPGPDNLGRRPEFVQVPMDFRLSGTKSSFTCEALDLAGDAAEAAQ